MKNAALNMYTLITGVNKLLKVRSQKLPIPFLRAEVWEKDTVMGDHINS